MTAADVPPPADDATRRAWAQAGVPADAIEGWRRWGFDPATAGTWVRAGVEDGLTATRWETAMVTPATVDQWLAEGVAADEAVRWHEFGFDLDAVKSERMRGHTPDQALEPTMARSVYYGTAFGLTGSERTAVSAAVQRFMQAGVDPQLMQGYYRHEWIDDEALEWARRGITVQEAYDWHDLGLFASEAAHLLATDNRFVDILRKWWPTGIPLEEVAEWIGAGLSAAEAIEQRAEGVTTEDVAARRVQRRAEGDAPVEPRDHRDVVERLRRTGPPDVDRFGPPPADEGAARDEIAQSFAAMFTERDANGGLALVEGGGNLGPSLDAVATLIGARISATPTEPATTVTVVGIRFVDEHHARALFRVTVRGTTNIRLADRLGRAALIDGRWLVERATVTGLFQLAGVASPPPLA